MDWIDIIANLKDILQYPTMLFSQSYISPILGYYRNKTISSTKSNMVKSEPSVIPNMTTGDSKRLPRHKGRGKIRRGDRLQ